MYQIMHTIYVDFISTMNTKFIILFLLAPIIVYYTLKYLTEKKIFGLKLLHFSRNRSIKTLFLAFLSKLCLKHFFPHSECKFPSLVVSLPFARRGR